MRSAHRKRTPAHLAGSRPAPTEEALVEHPFGNRQPGQYPERPTTRDEGETLQPVFPHRHSPTRLVVACTPYRPRSPIENEKRTIVKSGRIRPVPALIVFGGLSRRDFTDSPSCESEGCCN